MRERDRRGDQRSGAREDAGQTRHDAMVAYNSG
jgi:hypothetical protein